MGNNPALVEVAKPTKVERKSLREEQKWVIKAYSSSDDSKEEVDEEQLNIANTFKRYTIQARKILLQDPKRQKTFSNGRVI